MARRSTPAKKLEIFKRYSYNLHLLSEMRLLGKIELQYKQTYICPICLKQFSEENLVPDKNEIFLTAEDVPPFSLGGNANILTCSKCNSEAGHKIDNHLVNQIERIDKRQFFKNSEFDVYVKRSNNDRFQGKVIISDSEFILLLNKKFNNPKKISIFNEVIKKYDTERYVEVEVRTRKAIDERMSKIAILKCVYLKFFETFGYQFILNSFYDKIRKQILNPEYVNIFRQDVAKPYEVEHHQLGDFLLQDSDLFSFVSIFPLSTDRILIPFLSFMPFPIRHNLDHFYNNLETRLRQTPELYMPLIKQDKNYILNARQILNLQRKLTFEECRTLGLDNYIVLPNTNKTLFGKSPIYTNKYKR